MKVERTNKIKKKERLFSVYSKNLSFYKPEFTDHFLCPVCMSLFSRDDLKDITLAHIIPKSMGGKLTTLACSECDTRIGGDYDRHRSQEIKVLRQIKEKGLYCKLNYGSEKYGIIFEGHLSNNGHLDMHIRSPENVPSNIWTKRMDGLSDAKNEHFQINIDLFSPEKRNISYIYSSFLLMFSKLGYEYIFSPNVDSIRQVLMGDYSSLKNHRLVIDLPKPSNQVPIPSIYMLINPVETRTFCISLPSTKNGRIRCVFLPGFGESGESGYLNLLNLIGTQSILDAQLVGFSLWNCIPDIDDVRFKDYGKFIWDAFIQKADHPETKEIYNPCFKIDWP